VISVARNVGRLFELRTTSPVGVDEIATFTQRFAALLASTAGRVVTCLDLRESPVLLPQVSEQMLALLRQSNPRVERSAFLLAGGHATLSLQVERLIREANNHNRRAFRAVPELQAYLAVALDPAEQARLAAFLATGHEGKPIK
jgi:hypothetical protein